MIYSLTVGRNEEHRYLKPMIKAASETFDLCFFYDDQSTDGTVDIAQEYAVTVVRPRIHHSFLEHEGLFRQDAWNAFVREMKPREGDWVFVIDCDEILVGNHHLSAKEALHAVVERPAQGINIAIPEVFGFEESVPLIRTDRLWGTIFAPRLFRFRPSGSYAQQHFGVPAVPTYVMAGQRDSTDMLYLLHYGYAHEDDRKAKFDRYSGQPGHSSAHVQSILDEPMLEPWGGSFDARMRRNGDS